MKCKSARVQGCNDASAHPTHSRTLAPLHPLTLFLSLLIAACGGGAATEEEGHDHGAEPANAVGSTVTVTPAQFTAIEGVLGHVEQKDLTTALKATGFLKVPPQNIADITAAMGGTVREVVVHEGDHVKKGQTLALITDPAIIQLQRDHLDAKARLVFAKAELDRQAELAGANVSAQKTLQQATADHASLRAAVNATAEQLRLINIDPDKLGADDLRATASIVSPIDGTVANIAVNVGSKVSGDATMFRVVNNSKLHVDLFLYEQDIAQVKVGQTVDLSLTNLPGRNYKAVIFAIGSAFESETKTIPVHAEITGDKEGLINGMGVTARIDVGNATTTAVLTEAIVNMEGKDFIFVKITGEADHDHAHTEADGHVHVEGEVHDHSTEHAHTEGETHVHDHGAGDAHTHAGEEAHAHEAPTTAPGSMSFQRIEVKRGATDGAYTAVTFLQAVPDHAEVVTGGAYYLLAMLNTSSGHQH